MELMKHWVWVACALGVLARNARHAQTTPLPAWSVEGNQLQATMGAFSSGAGDVNGDGFGDLLVLAGSFTGDQLREGRLHLYLGQAGGPAKRASWILEGNQDYANFGLAQAAGDVNGDGYDDVVVGHPSYSNGQLEEGRAALYLGSPAGLSLTPAWNVESNQAGAALGSSTAAAGDVNGDGFDDVVVGVRYYSGGEPREGRALVYLGTPAGLAPTPVWSAEGNQRSSMFCEGVSAGDVNGDGFDDLLVGAPNFGHGEVEEGAAFLYLGSPLGPSVAPSWVAEGNQERAWFGWTLSSADVNGDGFDDVIVGAPAYKSSPGLQRGEGRATLYLGSAAGLSASPAWAMNGSAQGDYFGCVAGQGDVDGDGFDDVLIGANSFDNVERDEGRACLYYGSARGLSSRPGWCFESNQDHASLGFPLARTGDLNGDGLAEILVTAPRFDHGQIDEGSAFLFLGAARRRNP